ncbi:hydrogenase subunit MbhD domain-containing protein [Mycobacterium sp. smrl_JER01]|uniref:hydrogenase subunit MbhD domain-containing protein n=1 Tax=Mycobacterium sp. smrl_JER01 TaxID=3402633 RepID=UPI003AD454B5
MIAVTLLDVLLGVGVLVAATAALIHPDRVASVTTFLAVGVLLIAVWARLGAPDVALAEAALAAGVTGAMLIATVARDTDRVRALRWPALAGELLVALGLGGALGVVLVGAAALPGQDSLAWQATDQLGEAAVSHPVTAVLLDYRAYDTLLEIVVLTVAAIAALSLHPRGSLRSVDVPVDRRPALVGLVRVLAPVLALLAAWLLVAGSSQPGGAFQSGAVITGLLMLALLTGGVRVPPGPLLRALIVVGALVFLALAVLTAGAGGWLQLAPPWGGAAVVAVEAALAVSIGVALAVLIVAQEPSR